MSQWRASSELFARSVYLKQRCRVQRESPAQTVLCFRTCTESLYRAYTVGCIHIPDPVDCGRYALLTTSWTDCFLVSEGASVHYPVCRLRRKSLPRTRVNKGKRKGRGI